MLIDMNTRFCAALSAAGAAGARQVATYALDTEHSGNAEEPLILHFLVTTVFAGAAPGMTCDLSLETHTSDDFVAAKTVLWEKLAIPVATLAAKYEIVVTVPPGALRYIGFILTPQTQNCASGNYTVELLRSVQTNYHGG